MLVCCLVFAGVQAQKITREYNNVSLSEALRQLNEETEEYTISFLYNELEDFRITTSVHRKTVPDAIRQMIGFYPIRMTVEPGIANPSQQEIIVECPQKTAPRYKGTVIDKQGQPVAYANIALLSPQDSTLITGGVSNESGFFVIPCEQKPVLARISFVGYKTEFVLFDSRNAGNIRLKPETIMLNGVKVTGDRIFSKAENGHLTYNMPMLLEVYPANDAYEALTRIPGDAHHQRQGDDAQCRQSGGAIEIYARRHAGQGRGDAVGSCEISRPGHGHQYRDKGLRRNQPTLRTTDGRLAAE